MQDLVKKDIPRSFCDAVGGQVSISSDIQVQFFDQMHYYFFNWRGEEAPERDRVSSQREEDAQRGGAWGRGGSTSPQDQLPLLRGHPRAG